MSSALKAANNQNLSPFSQVAAPNAPKVLGNRRLTNFIFSFLPSSDWATGQRLCKAIKPDFVECQKLSGVVDIRKFHGFLRASRQNTNMVQEIQKIAAFIKRLEGDLFIFADTIKLFSGSTEFPELSAMSCWFHYYKESINSLHPEATIVQLPGRKGTRRCQAHCSEELVLKTLASLGATCPKLTSLEISRGDNDDKPCEALLKGLVDKEGQHRLRHLTIQNVNKTDDPRALTALCPKLESWTLREICYHFAASLQAPLTEIDVGNFIKPGEFEALAAHPTLTKVKIKGECVRQASLVHLSKIPHLQHLTFEGLGDIYDIAIEDLSCLAAAKELTTLELITHGHPGVPAILTTVPAHIQRVITDQLSKVTDADLEGFTRFADLRELHLIFQEFREKCQVTDRGLASLAKCNALRSLSLGARSGVEIQFTTDGILNLVCNHLPHLQLLDLRRLDDHPIDVEKIDAVLRERRPKLHVYITEKKPNKS